MSTTIDRFIAFAPRILGVTRILAGILFVCHGAQIVFGAFGGMPPGTPKLIVWTAGPIELAGGVLLAVGLFSRIAAFILSGLMASAYFMAHAPKGFWPNMNGGELAVVYCWLFLYLAAQGPGAWAIDNLRRRVLREPVPGPAVATGSPGSSR